MPIISRDRYTKMQAAIRCKDELARKYQNHMIRLADQNGTLQAQLLLTESENAKLRRKLDMLEAERGVSA